MRKPTDPRKDMIHPTKYITEKRTMNFDVAGNPTASKLLEYLYKIPREVDRDKVLVTFVNESYTNKARKILLEWDETIQNVDFEYQMECYTKRVQGYEAALKAFEDYNKRKASGEKEALEDEVRRLEERLAYKKAQLAEKANVLHDS